MRRQNGLKLEINALVESIALKISQNEHDQLEDLLVRRHNLLTELIPLHQTDEDRKMLLVYLAELRERDYVLMSSLVKQRDGVRVSLLQFNKLKEYIR
jgi:hypothetical protein